MDFRFGGGRSFWQRLVCGLLGVLVVVGGLTLVPADPVLAVSPGGFCDVDDDGVDDGLVEEVLTPGADQLGLWLAAETGLVLVEVGDPFVWRVLLCDTPAGFEVLDGPVRVVSPEALMWEEQAVTAAVNDARDHGFVKPGPRLMPHQYGLQVVNLETWLAVDPEVFTDPRRIVETEATFRGVTVKLRAEPVATVFRFSDGVEVRCESNELYDASVLPVVPCGRHWDHPTLNDDVVSMEVSVEYGVRWESSLGNTSAGVVPLLGDPINSFDLRVSEIQSYLSDGRSPPVYDVDNFDEVVSIWPGDDTCKKWYTIADLSCLVSYAKQKFLDEFMAALGPVAREAVNQIILFFEGCVSFFGDAIQMVVNSARQILAFLRDPVAFLRDKIEVAQTIFTQLKSDPQGFATQFANDILDQYRNEPPAKIAGAMACEYGIGLITGGAAMAKQINKVIDWINDRTPIANLPNVKPGSGNNDPDNDKPNNDDNSGPTCSLGRIKKCSCNSFPTGTLVLLTNGAYRPVELIDPGEQVVTYNTETQTWSGQPVLAQWSATHTGPMTTITIEGIDGRPSSISSTPYHLYWVNNWGEWIEADKLRPGDHLLGPNGVTSVTQVETSPPAPATVWELDTAVNDNFVVSKTTDTATLVHNTDNGCTKPTGERGGEPSGQRAKWKENDDESTKRSRARENDSADHLADLGYRVEQVDPPGDALERVKAAKDADGLEHEKNPDYLIEGRIFDSYAPSTADPRNIMRNIEIKLAAKQAKRFVVNLDDSKCTPSDILKQIAEFPPAEGIKELIIIKDGKTIQWSPGS